MRYFTASASTVGADAGSPIDDGALHAIQATHHFFADSLADLLASFHDVADHQQHQAAGPQAAKVPVPFDDRDVDTGPLRGNGRTNAGRPAADHQHVRCVQHGQFAHWLQHAPVLDRWIRSLEPGSPAD